jgi:hypothetical protein
VELARGHVSDRPFARTVYTLAAKRFTGSFTLTQNGKTYVVWWQDGTIVNADSPDPTDQPARIALTAGLVDSTTVTSALRAGSTRPERDSLEVLLDFARLTDDQILRIRWQTLGARATRVFALQQATYVVNNAETRAVEAGLAPIDVRWLVYQGVRQHYTLERLEAEISGLQQNGVMLGDDALQSMPFFGFGTSENGLLEELKRRPVTLAELPAAAGGLDRRSALAMVYALVACDCLTVTQTAASASQPHAKPQSLPPPVAAERPRASSVQPRAGVSSHPPREVTGQHTLPRETTGQHKLPRETTGQHTIPREATGQHTIPREGTGQFQAAGESTGQFKRDATGQFKRDATGQFKRDATGQFARPRSATMGQGGQAAQRGRSGATTGSGTVKAPMAGGGSSGANAATSGSVKAAMTGGSTGNVRQTIPPPSSSGRVGNTIPPSVSATMRHTAPPVAGTNPRATIPPRAGAGNTGRFRAVDPNAPNTEITGNHNVSGSQINARGKNKSRRHRTTAIDVKNLIAKKQEAVGRRASFFELLDVTDAATSAEIREAYFKLARDLHPDRLQALGIDDESNAQAQEVFSRINEAFNVLSSPDRLTQYKAMLADPHGNKQQDAQELAAKLLAAEEHFLKGQMALRRNHFAEALKEFEQAVELNEDEPQHLALLAWATWCAHPNQKETILPKVQQLFEKSISLSDVCVPAWFYSAKVAAALGKLEVAAKRFKRVLDNDSNHHEAALELRLLRKRIEEENAKKKGGLFSKR